MGGVVKIYGTLKNAVEWIGELTLFMGRTLQSIGKFSRRSGIFINQCEFIGVSSLAILCVAAVFIGAVLGYQLYKSDAQQYGKYLGLTITSTSPSFTLNTMEMEYEQRVRF